MGDHKVAKDSVGTVHLVDEEASDDRIENLPNSNAGESDILVSECTRDIMVQETAEVEQEDMCSETLDCDDCERVADF